MELSMEIATAAEKIKEQQALRMENTINATVSEALQNQLANLKAYLIETVQDDTRAVEAMTAAGLDGSSLADSTIEQQESATEPVCVDVGAQIIVLDELQALVNQVQLTEGSESCITSLRQMNQFFSEDFLEQCSLVLAQQINGLEPQQNELRQHLDNQEQVFAAARQKLESDLVQTFALNNEASLPEVINHTEALRNDLNTIQQQWSETSDGAERSELLQQAASVAAALDHYERLSWLVDTALLNKQCMDTVSLLNELRPALPVVMDADQLPLQQFGTSQVGECYRTEEQARAAAVAEYQQRLDNAKTEAQRQDVSYPHVLHVEIVDGKENAIAEWWEVSELGQQAREGHTEHKMATRIDFSVMAEEGYSLRLRGDNPPCDTNFGCDMMLQYFAEKYDVPIVYLDFDDNEYIYERDKRSAG
jgi:hypothetical protein